jgi:hypothetical protein
MTMLYIQEVNLTRMTLISAPPPIKFCWKLGKALRAVYTVPVGGPVEVSSNWMPCTVPV